MTYRTILLHIPMAARASQLTGPAIAIAKANGARLIGLYAAHREGDHMRASVGAFINIEEIDRTRHKADMTDAQKTFLKACTAAGIEHEWHETRIDDVPSNELIERSHAADLVILGQADPDSHDLRMHRLATEEVLIAAGVPVLFVPYAGHFKNVGTRKSLVAWTPTREATRAAHAALPFLTSSDSVEVITVDGKPKPKTPGGIDAFTASLQRHGVKAVAVKRLQGEIPVGSNLLARASDAGSDLLVMGGYGHSPNRERWFGGVTRDILEHMTVPVLMAH